MCVSRSVVSVCVWMYVTDTVDVVLCCPFIHALPRDLFVQQVDVSGNHLESEGKLAIGNALLSNAHSKLGFMKCDEWQVRVDDTILDASRKPP